MAEQKKKGLDTNSNAYTIAYSAVIVVVVAFLLAFVFQALKPTQDENVALDKKKQILNALNIRDIADDEAARKYDEVVVADAVADASGQIVEQGAKGGTAAGFKLNSADYKEGRLAVFVCDVDGQRKYVLPVYGMGLWGPINGFIALNADKASVYGAYFNHESETAGLGAEIKDNRAWQEQFKGKKVFGEGGRVALNVVKKGKATDPATEVDGVTGATLTSNGVGAMLREGLGKYLPFLKDNKQKEEH